jgi:hypothetical protein
MTLIATIVITKWGMTRDKFNDNPLKYGLIFLIEKRLVTICL